jgi:hypothetical protein
MMFILLVTFSLWTEEFESQAFFPPDDWLIVNYDALDACWFRYSNGHNSSFSACCYSDSAYAGLSHTNIDYLITPMILPSGADTTMDFWCRTNGSSPCSLDIMVSSVSPPSLPDFSVLASVSIVDTTWSHVSVPMGSWSGTPVYIACRICDIPPGQEVYLDDISLPALTTQPLVCNGRLRTKGAPVQKYMQVWGTHYEMGYAHGYLLGEEAMANLIRFAVGTSSLHRVTPTVYEYFVLPYFRSHFTIPQKYLDEAQGALAGCTAKGVVLMHPELGREMTEEDFLCLSALPDFNIFGCSSVSGWGQSTINDDTLQGGLMIARDLDYTAGNYTCIGNTSVIIACAPSSPDEERFVLLTVAGFMGCLSGVNEHGVGLCCDYGYIKDTTYIPVNSLVPFTLSCRDAIETFDSDTSGIHDIYDITFSMHDSSSLTCWDVHLFSPYDGAHPVPAGILEINNAHDSLRLTSDNIIAPAINSDWNLVVTNHERVLYAPPYCYRYSLMADSLNDDLHLTTQRAIDLENAAAGWGYYAGTIQQMVLKPNIVVEHKNWPCIGVSYAQRNQGAHVIPKMWYTWNELFDGVPGIEEHGCVPKRLEYPATIIAGPLYIPAGKRYKIYDATGRDVSSSAIAPGVYFVAIEGERLYKIIKIR